jgi:PEP-CTERM motif
MNLKSLRTLLAVGLVAMAGQSWATPSLPQNDVATWQDISNIQWSTDSGATWGNSALVVGQTVEFKFTMHKYKDGNHYGDFIKAWVDWNGDETFDNANETLLADYHVVNPTQQPYHDDNVVNEYYDFVSNPVTLDNTMAGDHFLLARVTCSDSLLATAKDEGVISSYTWSDQWSPTYTSSDSELYKHYFSPTAHYWQGQSKLVKLAVNDVPEPGTLALFAVAMAGMGWRRKQQANRA